jgi:hypothetical protein
MRHTLTFRAGYFVAASALFGCEVLIALYIKDGFIRFCFGDFLVVILIYCIARTFLTVTTLIAAFGTLLLAFVVEFTQYFHLIDHLRLQDSTVATLVLGNTFESRDLIAYTAGIVAVLVTEHFIRSYSAVNEVHQRAASDHLQKNP